MTTASSRFPHGQRTQTRGGGCHHLKSSSTALALAVLAGFLGQAAPASAAESASPGYRLRPSLLSSGGGTATSTSYRLDGTTGGHGGESRSGGETVVLRSGFKGTLNDPPQTLEDSVEWGVDKTLKVRVSSLLANDRDPDGDTVRLVRFDAQSTAGGTVVLDQGWLLYTPPNPTLSSDSFSYTVEDAAGHVASGQVTVVADAPDGEPSRNLVAIVLLPDGRRRLQFVGIAGRTYRIQASDQMPAVLWETQASLVADQRGRVDWIDPTQPAPPERYYRTVYP